MDSDGTTALVEAARAGHTEILRLLLEHRAQVDLHADNGSGATALIETLRNNHLEGARILLAHGASVHEKNARGETAIFFLMQNRASATPETRAEIDQILRTVGVDPEQGRSPAGEDSP